MIDQYKEKLKAFCEGLEMENIDELLTKPPDFFRMLGERMAELFREKQAQF